MVLIPIWPRVTFQLKVNRRSRPAAFFSFSFPFKSSLGLDGVFFCFFLASVLSASSPPSFFSFLQPLLLFHPQTFKTFISILVRAHYYIQSPAPPPLHLFIVLLYRGNRAEREIIWPTQHFDLPPPSLSLPHTLPPFYLIASFLPHRQTSSSSSSLAISPPPPWTADCVAAWFCRVAKFQLPLFLPL